MAAVAAIMASKLEYLQRYMSGGSGAYPYCPSLPASGARWPVFAAKLAREDRQTDATDHDEAAPVAGAGGGAEDAKKRRSKKSKKEKRRKEGASALGTRVVVEDHEWEQDAPGRDDVDQTWELDGGEGAFPGVYTLPGLVEDEAAV